MSLLESQIESVFAEKIVDAQTREMPRITQRDIWLPQVPGKALAVIGMRRAGKTTFLWQLMAQRLQAGTPREGMMYFSFEDERLAGLKASDLDRLVQTYYRLNPDWRDQRRAAFYLDEIQLVPGWETFARRLLDSENIDLYLSGSSARMLSREVASSMRGRALEAVVTPFSFREMLRHIGHEPTQPWHQLPKATHSQLAHDLYLYLAQGGFAEAQGLDVRSRQALLRNYVDVVLLRDVIERHNLSQPQVLRWMVQQLLGNAAGSFSINKFHADLKSRGVSVAKDTLHQLLAYLEDAFLLTSISICSSSIRQKQVNPRKVYPVDTGLIALFDRSGKANTGHALECAVLHQLLRSAAEVAYVHTPAGFEVDFHARYPDGREALIQVCADVDSQDTLNREIRALQDAQQAFPRAQAQLLVLSPMPSGLSSPPGIEPMLAADWLLNDLTVHH